MSIKGIGVEQSTINVFVNATEKSVAMLPKQETAQPFVATEGKRGDEQFYGEMRRSQVESKLNVKSYNSAANSLILEPTKKQAGKVEDFIKVMNESQAKWDSRKGKMPKTYCFVLERQKACWERNRKTLPILI